MRNLLVLSHDLPSPDSGATIPTYYLLKHLSTYYNIILVSFSSKSKGYMVKELKEFCSIKGIISIPEYKSIGMQLTYTLKNMLSLDNLRSKDPSLFNYYYHPKMQKKIKEILSNEKFDLIISDLPMAHYAKNEDLPKIAYVLDAVSGYHFRMYLKASNLAQKVYWFLQYHKMRHYEKNTYQNFEACIVVNQKDKQILNKIIPKTSIEVVPNGVNIDYFFPLEFKEEYPSLTFVGDMSTPPNINAVTNFYSEIYPQIKREVESLKFFIVGRNPPPNIKKLSENDSVVVTGSVEDVRPYIARSSLVIAPMISGTGIKNKILEAMAMQKVVITTTTGASGIRVSDSENIVIADDPNDFAKKTIELLNNKNLREKIGENAMKLAKNRYSWKKSAEMLNEIFQKIIKDRYADQKYYYK